ncbi:aminotransferase class V-fold PLP-dependent enzyme [Microbacterium halotolerans]|uniref:aminotransferase class V-fold PLP-dependent enzyme n=1 Tax=Microbacterium halotolerans TaxID=246613 RepID=UPI0013C31A84|nr:aminotransferase class V-fold PLP-dependent enzyme [Microbacterium halotolerans]
MRMIDVAHERSRTLGAPNSHHFNAAGAALPTSSVVEAVVEHLHREEALGGYEAAARVRDDVEGIYAAAGDLLGCAADEIALFDSASTGLRVLIDAVRPAAGSRIIASRSTYVSHALHLMTICRERDVELVIVPADEQRRVDLVALEALLADGRPSVLTVSHVPTSSGLVEPVAEIGQLARRYGATYLLDATQSVGHLQVDVAAIGCDGLVTTGRKFLRAPRGTAFAYVKRSFASALLPTAPDVRGSEWQSEGGWDTTSLARRFETWEASVAARLGLGVALREANERGMAATEAWLTAAGDDIRRRVREVPGVVLADPEGSRSAIVTFVIDGMTSAHAASRLSESGVRVVSVPATHGQWDLGDRRIPAVVRASPHVYNDEGDVDALVEGIARIAGEVRAS